jgi:heptaprenyl diphosphate synthase
MNTRKMVRLSLFIALATVLGIIENQLPKPPGFIWLKLGLANIITLIALVMYDTWSAVIVACMRSLLAGIFGALPMLIFSFPAAFTSSLSMGILYHLFGKRFSIVGLSIFGAVIHNLTQLLVAYLLLKLSINAILALAPVLIVVAVGAGLVTGLAARYVLKHLSWSET